MIFQLWVAPMHQTNANPGLKTTLQVGSDLWIKLRVIDKQIDLQSMMFKDQKEPKISLWAETDF
jgi:hypothetical protein